MIDLNSIIDKVLLEKNRRDEPRVVGRYYPSEIPYCLRSSYFNFYFPKPDPVDKLRLYEAGNMGHNWFVETLEAGLKEYSISELKNMSKEKSFSIVVDLDEMVSLEGRYDAFFTIITPNEERYLIEIKTQKNIFYTNEYKREHGYQTMPYIYHQRPCKGLIVYLDRTNYQSKILPEGGLEYDPKIMRLVFDRILLLHHYVKAKEVPPPEAIKDNSMKWMCVYCDQKSSCEGNEAEKGRLK